RDSRGSARGVQSRVRSEIQGRTAGGRSVHELTTTESVPQKVTAASAGKVALNGVKLGHCCSPEGSAMEHRPRARDNTCRFAAATTSEKRPLRPKTGFE